MEVKIQRLEENYLLLNIQQNLVFRIVSSATVVKNMAEKRNLTLLQAPPVYQLLYKFALTLTQNFTLQTLFRVGFTLLEENAYDSGKNAQPFFLCAQLIRLGVPALSLSTFPPFPSSEHACFTLTIINMTREKAMTLLLYLESDEAL